MRLGVLFGKRTWIGFGVTVGVVVLSLLLGALLAVRGILPAGSITPWICATYAIAAFLGGCVAAMGQGRRLCGLVPAVLLYALMWLLALCSECVIDFAANGVAFTCAVLLGGIAAYMSRRGKKKSHRVKPVKRPVSRVARR